MSDKFKIKYLGEKMKTLSAVFISILFLWACSNTPNNPVKPTNDKDYLSFYYKVATDSTYKNFRLVFTDSLPLNQDVYPRVYTEKSMDYDTLFLAILTYPQGDTVYAMTDFNTYLHEKDFPAINKKNAGYYTAHAFYKRNSQLVVIYEKTIVFK